MTPLIIATIPALLTVLLRRHVQAALDYLVSYRDTHEPDDVRIACSVLLTWCGMVLRRVVGWKLVVGLALWLLVG